MTLTMLHFAVAEANGHGKASIYWRFDASPQHREICEVLGHSYDWWQARPVEMVQLQYILALPYCVNHSEQ